MYRLLLFGFALFLGCHDPTTGGNSDSLPLPTVSYSARHTYPIVARAVLPKFAAQVSPGSSVVHAFEFDESDVSLVANRHSPCCAAAGTAPKTTKMAVKTNNLRIMPPSSYPGDSTQKEPKLLAVSD
jgi:hypothetical protein